MYMEYPGKRNSANRDDTIFTLSIEKLPYIPILCYL